MMRKYISIAILTIAISLQANAQSEAQLPLTHNAFEMGLIKAQWFGSANISGFGLDSIQQVSSVQLGYHSQEGKLHRVQEGGKMGAARFEANRFMSIGNYYLYGNFNFEQSRSQDKSWADVLDPYNSGPMIYGSNIKAPYDWQSFGLSVRLGSRKQARLMHGVSAKYQVGELTRQRDPRSLTDFIDYSIAPSISYQISDNTRLGANLTYRFKKESLESFKTIQDNPLISYYVLSGMDNYKVLLGQTSYNSFSRYFNNDYWGGDLQVQQNLGRNSKLMLSGGFTKMNQAVEGGSYREKPGNFDQNIFRGSADLIINSSKGFHHIALAGGYINSGSSENIQELSVTTNPETKEVSKEWITLYTYKDRFVSDDVNLKADYSYHRFKADNKNEYKWMMGAGVEYTSFDKKYRVPSSNIAASRLYTHIKGAYQVDMKNGKSLHFSLQMGYAPSLKTKVEGLQNNDYSKNVIEPDFEKYYKKDFVEALLNIRYEMPLSIKKSSMNLFIDLYAKNTTSVQAKKEHLSTSGLSIGILIP